MLRERKEKKIKVLKEESDTTDDEMEMISLRDSDATEGFTSEEELDSKYFHGNKENTQIDNYKAGDYVIFVYEGEYFVGKIESVNAEGALIKSMQKSLKNWKWPEKQDLNIYLWSDIKEKINIPQKTNSKREFYSVPEMNKYWEFTD